MIGIIDYRVGNIKAFVNIYKSLNLPYKIVKNINDLKDITKIILPGVGSFDYAMKSLYNSCMKEKLDELVIENNMPVLGVCVGLQMLAKSSDEGSFDGLGWIDGVIKRFDNSKLNKNTPLPHMGWNNIIIERDCELVQNLEIDARFYFLHSYVIECNNKDDIVASAAYSQCFTSIVKHKNIYGIQPHPEKSHQNGIILLKNFGTL